MQTRYRPAFFDTAPGRGQSRTSGGRDDGIAGGASRYVAGILPIPNFEKPVRRLLVQGGPTMPVGRRSAPSRRENSNEVHQPNVAVMSGCLGFDVLGECRPGHDGDMVPMRNFGNASRSLCVGSER